MTEDDANQAELIMEYFKKHPKRNIKHPEVVDWSVATYKKRTINKQNLERRMERQEI